MISFGQTPTARNTINVPDTLPNGNNTTPLDGKKKENY